MSRTIIDAIKSKIAPLNIRGLLSDVIYKTKLEYKDDPLCEEALRILMHSCKKDARLNLFGQIAARQHFSDLFETRLRLMDLWTHVPEIQKQNVLPPLFITGMPKSGSTFLHRLLAQDPSNRAPATWEVMFPLPPPERESFGSDPRIAKAEKRLRWLRWTRPAITRAHPIGARLPQECGEILAYSFQSYVFLDMFLASSYETWLSDQDMRPAYDFHMQILKHLQWHAPGGRWVLKSSDHVHALTTLLETYDEARIIFMHRDPTRVLQASASQTRLLKSIFSHSIDPLRLAADQVRSLTDKVNKIMEFREKDSHLAECFFDICYLELARDPMATVHAIYDRFGFELSPDAEERMKIFIEAERSGRRPDEYSLADFSLFPQQEDPRFDLYCERFGVGRELL